jgi:hypothetical protein
MLGQRNGVAYHVAFPLLSHCQRYPVAAIRMFCYELLYNGAPFFNAVFLLLRGVQLRRNVYLISELFRGSLSLIHTHHCLNLHYISPRCESLTQQSFTSYLGRLK